MKDFLIISVTIIVAMLIAIFVTDENCLEINSNVKIEKEIKYGQ